jgi:hypothetical protein
MKKFCKLALIGVMAAGPMALVGCDETVSKKEETKVNSDGSTKTEVESVKKTADGGTKTEHTVEKTPATQP